MHEHPNSLLKVGCLLFIVGGLASALVTLAGLLLSVGSMMDSELYPYVDQMARAQSDGLIGGDEIMAVFSGFVFVMGAIAVIMLIIDLTVGILGLSRSRRPEKSQQLYKIDQIFILVPLQFFSENSSFPPLTDTDCRTCRP